MENEEILKAAQQEPQEMGEYESSVLRKSLGYGAGCGVAVLLVLIVCEALVEKQFDFGKPAILFAIDGFSNWYYGRKVKAKKKLIIGIIELALALFGLLVFIGALFL